MKPQMSPLSLASLALVAALAACAKGESGNAEAGDSASAAAAAAPAAGTTNAEADLADLSRYELSMDKVDRYYNAQRNVFRKAKDMSPAEREALAKSQQTGNDANLDDMVRNVEQSPVMRDAVREAGLSAREYVMVSMALMQSMMASSVLQMRPNDNQDSLARAMKVNPENLKFIKEHQAELTQKQKAMEAEIRQMGATGS